MGILSVCTPHACVVHRGQNRKLDTLELEFRAVVSCRHMGAGIKPGISGRTSSVLNNGTITLWPFNSPS